MFETTSGAMRVRLHRARQALREQVEAMAASPERTLSSVEDLDAWARSLRPPDADPGVSHGTGSPAAPRGAGKPSI